MTLFLNAIMNLRHPEEARSAVSKDALLPRAALLVLPRRVQPLCDGDAEDAGEKAEELGAEPGVKAPGLARADAQEPDRRAAAKGEA
jgi:hypothetical protein